MRQLKDELIKERTQLQIKEHLNTDEDISATEDELGKVYTVTQDIIDTYLKPAGEISSE